MDEICIYFGQKPRDVYTSGTKSAASLCKSVLNDRRNKCEEDWRTGVDHHNALLLRGVQ